MNTGTAAQFAIEDLDDIVTGAHFLACGGGGALANGLRLAADTRDMLRARGADTIKVLAPAHVPDDQWMPVLGAIGSPEKYLKYGYGKSPVAAFLAHERLLKARLQRPSFEFFSLVAAETGTVAFGLSLLVAASLNLPVVDGDGAGRAIPDLEMITFANPHTGANIQLSPSVLASETPVKDGGVVVELDCNDPATLDGLARGLLGVGAGFEERASLSCYAMTGYQMKQPNALVPHTLSDALALARQVRSSRDPIAALRSLPGAELVCQGHVTGVEASTLGEFDWLHVHIRDRAGVPHVVVAKNENMLVWRRDQTSPLASAPDLICYAQPDGTFLSNTEIERHFATSTEPLPIVVVTLPTPEALDNDWTRRHFAAVLERCGYFGTAPRP